MIWYRSQRTLLGKIGKKQSGQKTVNLTPKQRWVKNNLGFLQPHIVPRPQGSQLGRVASDDEAPAQEDSEPPSPSERRPAKKKSRTDVGDALLEYLKRSEKQTEEIGAKVDAAATSVQDERQAWVEWMLSALRPLPRHLWRDFTKEAFSLVTKYQERAESEQSPQVFQQPPQMQPVFRPTTPVMMPTAPLPARPSSVPVSTQWSDAGQQIYSLPTQQPQYHLLSQPSFTTTQASQVSTYQQYPPVTQGASSSFNLSDMIAHTPPAGQGTGGDQSANTSGSRTSDIMAVAARTLEDDSR